MDKCLPLVEQSQAEVLILLSEKNIDCDTSKNLNTSTNTIYFNYYKTSIS